VDNAERLAEWERNGYVILQGVIPAERIDAMFADVDRLVWDAVTPDPEIEILNVSVDGQGRRPMSHREFVERTPESRRAIRDSYWRIEDFFKQSNAARDVVMNAEIAALIDVLLGRPSKVRSSVTLFKGGETRVHQDAVLFACEPFNMTATIGVACEDVHPDAGPLLFYPGSNKLPLWDGWTDYPRTMLKTCTPETADAYHRWLEGEVRKLRQEKFVVRKGDAVIWHGSLAHKASKPNDPNRTQRLCVIHSFPDGVDRTAEVLKAQKR
jgi:ectoine hydroxylase-related dioxygenase (phytanoyl-CoA dioxygenase family)